MHRIAEPTRLIMHDEMHVIIHKAPSDDMDIAGAHRMPHKIEEPISVLIILEYHLLAVPPNDYMVVSRRRNSPRSPRHIYPPPHDFPVSSLFPVEPRLVLRSKHPRHETVVPG